MERIRKLLPAAAEAELYQLHTVEQGAAFREGKLNLVQSRSLGGLALRVVNNGGLGFATASNAESIPWMVKAAMATAELGSQAKLDWPTEQVCSQEVDPQLAQLSEANLIEIADKLQQKIVSLNSGFVTQASALLIKDETKVQNTAGGSGKTNRIRLAVSCSAELVQGQDILNVYGNTSCGRLGDLDLDSLVAEVFGPLLEAPEVVSAVSGQQPVLLTAKAFSSLISGPLLAAFSGRNVLRHTSPLSNRLGEQFFSPELTLVDDATLPLAPSSAAIDDEGTRTRRFPLIEAGVVKGFAYDLATAAAAAQNSTGHARKVGRTSGARLNSQPAPGFSNVLVQPGESTFADLLQAVGDGVVVDQISGTPGFNPSGEFTVTIQLGYLVKQGRISGRIKNAMLTGSAFKALQQIRALGKNSRWLGGGESGALSVPPMVVDGLIVTAK